MSDGNSSPGGRCAAPDPSAWFAEMIDHCYDYAAAAKAQGRPIVGILCEFTPRELILAAGGVPVCLCGGSAATIPAAEQHLPANLCPLIKSTFGYHLLGKNPFLSWADLVVGETTCDGKKKMFELLGATKPMYVLELPQKPDDPDALDHWTREVRKLREHFETRFGVRITEATLREAVVLMNRERALRRQLADLMIYDPPPLTGRQLIEFRSIISGLEADLRQYETALAQFREAAAASGPADGPTPRPGPAAAPASRSETPSSPRPLLAPDVRARRGLAPPTREARQRPVRVLLTGVPLVRGAERVLDLIEASGAVVVCQENCTGLKPILEDVDPDAPDLLRAIAEKYFHLPCSVMTPNRRRFDSLRVLAAKFRPHCVIELIWQACLTYDVEAAQVRRLVEEDLGLPYLKITTDYAPSDSARLSARVEALVETIRARKAS